MKLFLASKARHPDSVKKLENFVGGFINKTIAYIPTAENGESSYGSWKIKSETWKLVNTLSAKVEAVVLENYKNSSVMGALKGKDIIWIAGGMCGYLMYWIRRCELDKNIREILNTGPIYVGSSAGSMICSPTLTIAEQYPGDEEYGAGVIPGLGLVNFDILPHFEDSMMESIKDIYKGKELYLLKDGEAITIEDNNIEVLGEKRIYKG